MGRFVRGDVLVVPFPFSNHSEKKHRPAVVLALGEHNDLVMCLVTSQITPDPNAVPLGELDFVSSPLVVQSYARPLMIMTMEESLVIKKISRLTNGAMKRILAVIQSKLA